LGGGGGGGGERVKKTRMGRERERKKKRKRKRGREDEKIYYLRRRKHSETSEHTSRQRGFTPDDSDGDLLCIRAQDE
jgi:hypothetical protein